MTTLALPKEKTNDFTVALFGAVILFLASQIQIPMRPVPFTMQTLAIYLMALKMTPRQAVISTIFYLGAATLGAPVLAGFNINPLWFLGTNAGYLAAFPLAAYIVAKCKNLSVGMRVTIAAFTLKAIGMTYLSTFIGWKAAFIYGFALFIPSYIIKVMIAVAVSRKVDA
ncbi:MAG: biotin transporter BioY [Simkaniaceae bacterium]|nr:biotin transporter BioY [Simkaniaceae bacterium]